MYASVREWRRLFTMPELALLVGKKRSEFSSVGSTDRQGEGKGFGSTVQEQQKTFPLDRVVKNGCRGRGGIWHVTWRKGGANIPTLAHHVPLLLPAAGRGHKVEEKREKDGGKQVELRGRGRQADTKSISEKDRQTERRNEV